VLPYWTPSGTPYFDCDTPGAILGLRLSTHRNEILRALLEGVAFEMRLNLEILSEAGCAIDELYAIGGGARSAKWNQLKADILGRPLARLEVTEAGCLGAAILACAADTGCTSAEIAARWIKPGVRFAPNSTAAGYYSEQFEHFRRLRPLVGRIRQSG
jgi:xylulokinase